MSTQERELREGSLISCPQCKAPLTELVAKQEYKESTKQWELQVVWRECSDCSHKWDREPPLKPWQVE
jgi:hypothetical protein